MDRKVFYDKVRKSLFGGSLKQSQVFGLENLLNNDHDVSTEELAYVLATVFHETARTMEPVRETLVDTDEKAIYGLERAWNAGQLSWVTYPYWRDGYFGRGYVQLTWKYNYKKAEDELGFPLVEDPSLALHPGIAVQILYKGMIEGWFTGKKLSDYIKPGSRDYRKARKIINGMDRANTIAKQAERFYEALRAAERD